MLMVKVSLALDNVNQFIFLYLLLHCLDRKSNLSYYNGKLIMLQQLSHMRSSIKHDALL